MIYFIPSPSKIGIAIVSVWVCLWKNVTWAEKERCWQLWGEHCPVLHTQRNPCEHNRQVF